jgi:hypothetical protein
MVVVMQPTTARATAAAAAAGGGGTAAAHPQIHILGDQVPEEGGTEGEVVLKLGQGAGHERGAVVGPDVEFLCCLGRGEGGRGGREGGGKGD